MSPYRGVLRLIRYRTARCEARWCWLGSSGLARGEDLWAVAWRDGAEEAGCVVGAFVA